MSFEDFGLYPMVDKPPYFYFSIMYETVFPPPVHVVITRVDHDSITANLKGSKQVVQVA